MLHAKDPQNDTRPFLCKSTALKGNIILFFHQIWGTLAESSQRISKSTRSHHCYHGREIRLQTRTDFQCCLLLRTTIVNSILHQRSFRTGSHRRQSRSLVKTTPILHIDSFWTPKIIPPQNIFRTVLGSIRSFPAVQSDFRWFNVHLRIEFRAISLRTRPSSVQTSNKSSFQRVIVPIQKFEWRIGGSSNANDFRKANLCDPWFQRTELIRTS